MTMHDTIKAVENEGRELIHEAHDLFVSKSTTLVAFLKPWAKKIEAEGKTVLIDGAKAAVVAGEDTPGDGVTKMEAALAAFAATCAKEGLAFVESEARALIEVALQNFKATLGTSGAAEAQPSYPGQPGAPVAAGA